jgi:anti-sigma regulatory factor (Ser/Thr protein kinase)
MGETIGIPTRLEFSLVGYDVLMAIGGAQEPTWEIVLPDEAVDEAEAISLTLPHDERFLNVARIVVGGLAARLDLPYESLDDLQLGVESVLSVERYAAGGEVTVEIEIGDRVVRIFIAPLDADSVERDLELAAEGIGLNVLLGAVVDSVGFVERDGGERWLVLEKRVPRAVDS